MSTLDMDTTKTALVGEVLMFGLLGKALYEEPEKNWLETLISEDVFAEVPFGIGQQEVSNGLELLQRWSKENRNGISDDEFKALKQDYLHLFIGVARVLAPPWESVYFNYKRLTFQEQTLQVREWYSRFGLQSEKINKEPDDHIGLEMLFVSLLASRALRALEDENQQYLNEVLQAQRDFLFEHLLRWGPVCAREIQVHAETDFYRGMAHLLHGVLLETAEFLKIEMPKEASL